MVTAPTPGSRSTTSLEENPSHQLQRNSMRQIRRLKEYRCPQLMTSRRQREARAEGVPWDGRCLQQAFIVAETSHVCTAGGGRQMGRGAGQREGRVSEGPVIDGRSTGDEQVRERIQQPDRVNKQPITNWRPSSTVCFRCTLKSAGRLPASLPTIMFAYTLRVLIWLQQPRLQEIVTRTTWPPQTREAAPQHDCCGTRGDAKNSNGHCQ